jgi:hypothetical protein
MTSGGTRDAFRATAQDDRADDREDGALAARADGGERDQRLLGGGRRLQMPEGPIGRELQAQLGSSGESGAEQGDDVVGVRRRFPLRRMGRLGGRSGAPAVRP